jgi:exopolyphosphatase/pppGpp-phosphohydrolase
LFDDLTPWHGFSKNERELLKYAALLHDIGWITGEQGHHKTALNIIMNTATLPFPARERLIVGLVARYHRKSHPDTRHPLYASLEPADRRIVAVLAAILRIADALDRSHNNLIKRIQGAVSQEEIKLVCQARASEQGEITAALAKGTLLEQILGRKLVIEWTLPQDL